MVRFEIVVLALATSIASVACGGSAPPPKDPSTDPNGGPATGPKPPPPPELGIGGTGTPPPQGIGH